MSDVRAVKVRNGIFSLYGETGDFVGRVDTDTGRALIGDAFYFKERTCSLEYDTVHHDYVCTKCGERYDSGMYTSVSGDDKFLLKPMKFCTNCGAKVVRND